MPQLDDHADAINEASIAIHDSIVAAAQDSVHAPRNRAARRRLELAVRALDAVDLLRAEVFP